MSTRLGAGARATNHKSLVAYLSARITDIIPYCFVTLLSSVPDSKQEKLDSPSCRCQFAKTTKKQVARVVVGVVPETRVMISVYTKNEHILRTCPTIGTFTLQLAPSP